MARLIIDTSTQNPLIAIDNPILTQIFDQPGNDSALFIIRSLDHLARVFDDCTIKSVLVGTGPGSYTGLRVGLAAAKMWAYAKKLPLIGVNSLLAFAPSADEIEDALEREYVATVFDARGGGLYAMKGKKELNNQTMIWNDPKIVRWFQIPSFFEDVGVVYHPHCQTIKTRWEQVGGANVKWVAQKPGIGEMLRVADLCGDGGSWETQYREIEINYLK